MSRAFHGKQSGFRGDKSEGASHLLQRSEGVPRTMYEERGSLNAGEMGRAKLIWFSRRVQGIGKQQQAVHELRIGGGSHAGLAAAVGMTSEKHPLGSPAAGDCGGFGKKVPHRQCGAKQTLAILIRRAQRRTLGPSLAERQIAPQHEKSGSGESARHCQQQGRAAVRSRAVCQHQASDTSFWGAVQKSVHRDAIAEVFFKRLKASFGRFMTFIFHGR